MSYSNDKSILEANYLQTIELKDSSTGAKLLLSPSLQGRVMTSTLGDGSNISFGWINHELISSRFQKEFHNPFGGEERFWIGPEGGKFSFYFQSADDQDFYHWRVPGVLDNGAFYVETESCDSVTLTKHFELRNAIGSDFNIKATRKVSLCSAEEISNVFGIEIDSNLKVVAYRTDNSLTNCGETAWDKKYGMPCVWVLGMYNCSPEANIYAPFVGTEPKIVTNYFGPLPEDRISKLDSSFKFKADGQFRSKIGLPKESTNGVCGCYDASQGTLSVIKTDICKDGDYMNAVWGKQESAFGGDAVNAYNDGPTETGDQMGPFLEIETSSAGMALQPGQTATHTQYTFHLKASKEEVAPLLKTLFGV